MKGDREERGGKEGERDVGKSEGRQRREGRQGDREERGGKEGERDVGKSEGRQRREGRQGGREGCRQE